MSNRGELTGLSLAELKVLDALIDAAETFSGLDRQHPDELRDFIDGIHRCQYILAMRAVRGSFPIGWPTKQ